MTSRPLRFAMLTTFYPPYNFGGDGIGIRRLARALAGRGHEVTVIHDVDAFDLLHDGAEPEPQSEPEGVKVVPLRSGAVEGEPMTVYGTGEQTRCSRHVSDVVRAIELLISRLAALDEPDVMHRLPRLDAFYFRRSGQLEAWGTPGFRARMGLRRAARAVRVQLTGAGA
ncbi:MAG: hypothetical protein MJB57_14010 [Gemmatimonadetes bacterium]|nr:hypothetical protein [Gemmatimonadota bacterium]